MNRFNIKNKKLPLISVIAQIVIVLNPEENIFFFDKADYVIVLSLSKRKQNSRGFLQKFVADQNVNYICVVSSLSASYFYNMKCFHKSYIILSGKLKSYIALLLILFFCSAGSLFSQIKNETGKSNDELSIIKNDKALSYFIEGKTLELKNDYIGAIENFRTALKYDKSPGIYYALSKIYFKLSKFDEALSEINNSLKINPENQNYLEVLADIYIGKKEFSKAISAYEKIILLDSSYTFGLYSLARLYQEMKMPAKAIVIYEKITNKIGYDFDVLNKMYEIYYGYKDLPKSIEVLESILKLDPYNTSIKKLLSSLYLRNNQFDKTKDLYEQILNLNPQDKDVQTELVKIYFKENDSRKAFEKFSKMLGKDSLGFWEKVQIGELYYNMISQDSSSAEISNNIFENLNIDYPDHWIPYYYLGALSILLEKSGNNYKDYFNSALQKADTSREIFVNIGYSYFLQNDIADALEIIDAGLYKFPEDYRLNYFKGLSLQKVNKESESIKYFEKAVVLNPADLSILSTLALAYDNQGEYSKSADTYEKALSIDPQNPLILNNYAYNLSERGVDLEKALRMSEMSIEKEPQNSSYLDTYGWIFFKMKNYKQAKKYIEKSLEINGNNAVVLEHLGDIYHSMKDASNAKKYWNLSLNINPGNTILKEKIEKLKSI